MASFRPIVRINGANRVLPSGDTLPMAIIDGLATALSGKVDTTDPRLTNAREWTAETVSQAEAEGGESTARRAWTSQRVRQAIVAWWNSIGTTVGKALLNLANPGAVRFIRINENNTVTARSAADFRTDLGLGTAATATLTTSTSDTTLGRVVKVGDYGIGAGQNYLIAPDFNTLVIPGNYHCGSSATNGPGAFPVLLNVIAGKFSGSNDRLTQEASTYNVTPSRYFRRSYDGTSWTAWDEYFHSGSVIPVENGGTNANNAADARANLGLGTAASYNVSAPAARWNSVAVTGPDGETEVGQYIDFHGQSDNTGDTTDFRVGVSGSTNPDLNFYNDELTLNAVLTHVGALRALTEFTFVTDSDTGVGHPTADNVSLKTGGSDRLTINSSGNVGIGTPASSIKLDVRSATDQETLVALNSSATLTNPVVTANQTSTTDCILFRGRTLAINRFEIDGMGRINGASGSEARPSYSRMGDTDTGIYFPADDTVGVTTSGVSRIVVNNSQITEQYLGVRGTGPGFYVRKNLGSTQDTPITGKLPYVLIAPKRVAGSTFANGFTGTVHVLRGGPGALLIKNTVNVDVFVAYQTNRVGSPLLLDNSITLAGNNYFCIVEVTYNGETWYALDLGFYVQADVSIDGITYGVQTPFLVFADSTPGFSDENKVLVAKPTRIQSASNNVVIEAADTGNVYIGTKTTPQALTVNGTTVTAGIPIAFTGGPGGTAANTTRANLGLGSAATANLTTSTTDQTVGSVLKVGDFGLGKPFPLVVGVDWNDYTTPGVYQLRSHPEDANSPPPNTVYWLVMVQGEMTGSGSSGDQPTVTQLAMGTATSGQYMYYRARMSNTWTQWYQVVTDTNINWFIGSVLSSSGYVKKVSVPTTPTSLGAAGTIAFDENHAYFCIAANTWRRVALSTW